MILQIIGKFGSISFGKYFTFENLSVLLRLPLERSYLLILSPYTFLCIIYSCFHHFNKNPSRHVGRIQNCSYLIMHFGERLFGDSP